MPDHTGLYVAAWRGPHGTSGHWQAESASQAWKSLAERVREWLEGEIRPAFLEGLAETLAARDEPGRHTDWLLFDVISRSRPARQGDATAQTAGAGPITPGKEDAQPRPTS